MRENQNFFKIFSFRENFGNVKWTKQVIELLEGQGIKGITDNMVYIANKTDGQCQHRDEIRAATEVVFNQLKTKKETALKNIKAMNAELV